MAGGILDFEGKQFTNKQLATNKNLAKAKEVTFLKTSVTDEGLLILKNCKNLTSIYVDSDIVTGEFVPQLEGMKTVEALTLIGKKIGKYAFEIPESIQKTVTSLEYFEGVSDMVPLLERSFKEINSLKFIGNKFSDKAIVLGESCPKLDFLILNGNKITGEGIEKLPNNSNLILDLGESSITDDTIKKIAESLSELTQLRVNYCSFLGKSLKALKACKKLTAIELGFAAIDRKYLRDLVFLPEGCVISLTLSQFTEEDLNYVRRKRPDLEIFNNQSPRSITMS